MLEIVNQGEDMHRETQQKSQQCRTIEEENDEELKVAWDDVSRGRIRSKGS